MVNSSVGGDTVFESQLSVLIANKGHDEKRRITRDEIHDETGISKATITRWMSLEPFEIVHIPTAYRFMGYLQCEFFDLLNPVEAHEDDAA